ncbi:MAG: hypothetical protein ONB16_07820 [candidate division KSB1 bacterium]|nr:hypothetical protein [candidate division KSB1 bacterium]MDZ7319783.1 hypothetical protein [candidate division KSB1 bacterium]
MKKMVIISVILLICRHGLATEGINAARQLLAPTPLLLTKLELRPGWSYSATFANSDAAVTPWSSEPKVSDAKDRRVAFLRSLILPGAGEYYLGKHSLAKAFFFTEISLWVSYFAFREYGTWVRQDALAFAATHSGAQIKGKSPQFYVDLGNYQDVYEYNAAKQRMFEFEKVYHDESYFWSWDIAANRQKFDHMRIAGDRAKNRAVFVLGGIFANHLLSAIHAVWQTHRYNKALEKAPTASLNIYFQSDVFTNRWLFSVQQSF